jgi:hypothetical protein
MPVKMNTGRFFVVPETHFFLTFLFADDRAEKELQMLLVLHFTDADSAANQESRI